MCKYRSVFYMLTETQKNRGLCLAQSPYHQRFIDYSETTSNGISTVTSLWSFNVAV